MSGGINDYNVDDDDDDNDSDDEQETEFGNKCLSTKYKEKETSGSEFKSDNQQDGCIPFQSSFSYDLPYRDC